MERQGSAERSALLGLRRRRVGGSVLEARHPHVCVASEVGHVKMQEPGAEEETTQLLQFDTSEPRSTIKSLYYALPQSLLTRLAMWVIPGLLASRPRHAHRRLFPRVPHFDLEDVERDALAL